MTEKLALQHSVGEFRHRHRDEGSSCAFLVEGAGHQLLPGTGFALNQDGRGAGRDAADRGFHAAHADRGADQPLCADAALAALKKLIADKFDEGE